MGYTNKEIPIISTRLGLNGKIRNVLRFKTFTYSSFNWIQESFYLNDIDMNKKILSPDIYNYLSPLALAIWVMDDGGKIGSGLKLCTNNFSYLEIQILSFILNSKYHLNSTVISAGYENQYNIYIPKASIPNLQNLVKPYLHPSMYYKLCL